jgi:hypothetical protein
MSSDEVAHAEWPAPTAISMTAANVRALAEPLTKMPVMRRGA